MSDEPIHQICAWSVDSAAYMKVNGSIPRFINGLKVRANRFEKLATNSVIDCQPRIEFQPAVKRDCATRSQASIRRAQNQLVNRDQSGAQMIFCLGLLQVKLLQFFDLENLPKQHQQTILLNSPITQENFAAANERIRVGNFPRSLKTPSNSPFTIPLGPPAFSTI